VNKAVKQEQILYSILCTEKFLTNVLNSGWSLLFNPVCEFLMRRGMGF